MLEIIDSTGFGMQLEQGVVIGFLLVPIIIRLLFYVLRGIGIYTISKRAGVKQAWMGFVPCIWVYPLFKTLKNEKFFGSTFGRVAVVMTVVFALSEIFEYFSTLVELIPVVGYYLQGGTVSLVLGEVESVIMLGTDFVNPLDTAVINTILKIIDWISAPLSLVALVAEVFIFVALFKRYWANNYILGTVLSVFGLFGLMVFIIRKKQPRDFNEYLRDRYPNVNNPYGPNPYGRPQQPTNNYYSSNNDEPFKDFSSNREEPFSEFDDKDNK